MSTKIWNEGHEPIKTTRLALDFLAIMKKSNIKVRKLQPNFYFILDRPFVEFRIDFSHNSNYVRMEELHRYGYMQNKMRLKIEAYAENVDELLKKIVRFGFLHQNDYEKHFEKPLRIRRLLKPTLTEQHQ